ncbi:hypothetical protein JCM19992_08610 [Thermostilla marina]
MFRCVPVDRFLLVALVALAVTSFAARGEAAEAEIVLSTHVGAANHEDTIAGIAILSDGNLLVAANVRAIGGELIRVHPQTGRVTPLTATESPLADMACTDDRIALATASGVDVIDVHGTTKTRIPLPDCRRVDLGRDGTIAAIADNHVHVFDPRGNKLAEIPGGQFTNDVCVDAASQTVVFCGFRNARAFDGKKTYPVQICYIRGYDYHGNLKWTDYDWSTDRESPRFLNRPENNMADSRADRCAIGADGKLYVTFQVAGGNHLFRYDPQDITRKVKIVGGDAYHAFYNSRSEHKNFCGCYDPATGKYLAGQQFCGRLSSGRANAVVTKDGNIAADARGRVLIGGKAASGLPLSLDPFSGEYTGGGFALLYGPQFGNRLLCTRLAPGEGNVSAVAIREIDGSTYVAMGGSGVREKLYVTSNAPQPKAADTRTEEGAPREAFVALIRLRP